MDTASASSVHPSREVDFIPALYSPRFTLYFGRYVRRMIAKSFAAVRVMPDGAGAIEALSSASGPALVLVSHSAWWDPLIGLALHQHFLRRPSQEREPLAPMDAAMLRKFSIFKRLGIFGIAPDDPRSLEAMGEYVRGVFARNPRSALWITPQGRFTDPREPVTLRPGAAAIAARTPGVSVVGVSVEYAFWTEQKPEVFLRFVPIACERADSTAAWHRSMTEAMERSRVELAAGVISRDPARFVHVFDSAKGVSTNRFYDLWLRLRGRSTQIEDRRFQSPR